MLTYNYTYVNIYGVNAVGDIDVNDIQHGHAVIRNGKLVYKRRPGESTPVVNKE